MKALLDYDIIVYAVGLAADNAYYETPDGKQFQYIKEAKAHDPNVVRKVNPDPIEFCCHSVKVMINSIVKAVGADSYVGYLTGEGNYRQEIDSILPYKGNRENAPKPFWYEEIRDYLVRVHHGVVVDGMEADDMLSIEQMEVINDRE